MYRLYISKDGRYTEKEKYVKQTIQEIFTIIDNSMTQEDKYTRYLVIEDHNGEHGDKPILFFYNYDLPILGLNEYYETKEKLERRLKK